MDILYISALSSERLINDIYHKTNENPGFAVQKFSRLIVGGLIANGHNVVALSNPPITRNYSKKFCVKLKSEYENDIRYKYIPYINIPILKHICVFLYSFIYILTWGLNSRENKRVICDALSISAIMGTLLATKINRVKCCGVFTDIYGLMVDANENSSFMKKMATSINRWYSKMFSHYVLLTEEMNYIVNLNNRPYIVMEALCDSSDIDCKNISREKNYPKVILYAGGIEEKYGLKMLVEAFKLIDNKDVELRIYGSGSYVKELREECLSDSRIRYMGVKSNSEVIDAEYSATLLVNPRFTTEEFTKYSFPSKNMEYMVSGTPLLTTVLPGMPREYHNYVFLLDEESVDGYARKIREVVQLDPKYLEQVGRAAREYVIMQKNNIKQTERIASLIR